MSSLDEVIAQAQANISSVDGAQATIDATKSKVQEVHSQFAGLGADAKASEAAALTQAAEQAQQMFEPVKQKLEELVAQAQGAKTGTLGAGNGATTPASAPTLVVRPREGDDLLDVGFIDMKAIRGDPVEPPGGGPDTPGGSQRELNRVDNDAMSKARQSFRTIARNAGDGRAQIKDTVDSGIPGLDKWVDPWGSQAKAETRVESDPGPPPGKQELPHSDGDLVASWALMGAFAAEAGIRSIRGRQGKDA